MQFGGTKEQRGGDQGMDSAFWGRYYEITLL